MWGHYWNSTTCIRSDKLGFIEQAITDLLEQEGGCRINQLPPLEISIKELTRNNTWHQFCNFWILGLFPGKDGWTIVKTWSSELLCHQMVDNFRPRLSALAMQLGCDAFYLSVYEDIFGILMEVNAAGCIYVSGVFDVHFPGEQFYQQPINETKLLDRFSLLKVPELFQEAMGINEDPELKRKEAEYKQLKTQENPDNKLLKALDREISQGHTERIDLALGAVMNASNYWYCNNLVRDIYACPEKLSVAGTRLLYFRPPINYKIPPAYKLTREQWLDIFGIEPPVDD